MNNSSAVLASGNLLWKHEDKPKGGIDVFIFCSLWNSNFGTSYYISYNWGNP